MPVLQDESEKIYYAIFKKKPPVWIKNHFENLSKRIEADFPEKEIIRYRRYTEKTNDLEALELAARHLKQIPLLTVKFNIMIYLAETVHENYSVYINTKDSLLSGYLLLIASAFRSLYKFSKGVLLLLINKL